jgi:DNA-binding transcriptional LysR family regulator
MRRHSVIDHLRFDDAGRPARRHELLNNAFQFVQSIDIMKLMNTVNLSAVDLNLLVVLGALLDEAHVRRAGERVGLSQPAASHALARLRDLFGDSLLVRVGTAMVRTPKAEALRKPLAEFIASAKTVLSMEEFVPQTSRRRFRIMLPDLVCHLMMPSVIERLSKSAPGIRIDLIPWRGPALLTDRALNEIDFFVTSFNREFPGFTKSPLYEDTDALAVRAGHPGKRLLSSVKGFQAHQHVSVVGAGEARDELDEWLDKVGLQRNVVVAAPSHLLALRIAAATDLVAFVPRRFAAARKVEMNLALVKPPIDPGVDVLYLFTPVRAVADEGTVWMSKLIAKTVRMI